MALPNIILPQPYVLVTQTSSASGILPIGSNLKFGEVVMVYATSDRVLVGQIVMFDVSESQEFSFDDTIYNIVKDDFVSGQEPPLP